MSLVFFAAVILIGPMLMMNLLLSLLYEGFENTKEVKLQKTVANTKVLITEAGPDQKTMGMSSIMKNIEESGTYRKERRSIDPQEAMRKVGSIMMNIHEANLRWKFKGQSWQEKLSMSNFRMVISHCLILVQVVLVCLERGDWSNEERLYVGVAFGVCMVLWMVDLGIMITTYCSTTEPDSLKRKLDAMDVVLFLLLLADYIWKAATGLYIFEDSTPLTLVAQPLVCLRIIKLVFENPFDEKLSLLMRALFETIHSLLPFIAVIVVLTFFEAAVGLQMFHDQLKLLKNQIIPKVRPGLGHSPPLNFDTLASSFATFAAFLGNEEWHNTLYRFVSLGRRWLIPFFMLVVITGFILSELFLATYINTYIQKVKEYQIIEREIVDLTPEEERMQSVRGNSTFNH